MAVLATSKWNPKLNGVDQIVKPGLCEQSLSTVDLGKGGRAGRTVFNVARNIDLCHDIAIAGLIDLQSRRYFAQRAAEHLSGIGGEHKRHGLRRRVFPTSCQ